MKSLKKLICLLTSVSLLVLCMSGLMGCSEDRESVLRLFVPGEYLSPDVYEEFEEWYFEQTGKPITVIETTFDTPEAVLYKIEKSKQDFDLACPSDYMIEYMVKNGLAKKIDKSLVDIEGIPEGDDEPLIKQTYLDVTEVFDPTLEYTVPYMYGTFGIMYDYSKTDEHFDSWEYMYFEDNPTLGEKYKNKITQKESVREMYAATSIYAVRKELSDLSNGFSEYTQAYKERIQKIYEDTSDENIAEVKRLLQNQKKYLLKYEVDDGKFGIAGGTLRAVAGLYWSCDAGYVMGMGGEGSYEDANGDEISGNKNLWYAIPKEGGNVYIDGFVIPKYAGNETAANLFLQFICTQDAAIANSEWAGAISPVSSAYNALYEEYSENDGFFDGTEEGWKEMYLDMLFPSDETLLRCGVMKKFENNNSKINRMFADIVG